MFPDPGTTDGHPADRAFALLELITPQIEVLARFDPSVSYSMVEGVGPCRRLEPQF